MNTAFEYDGVLNDYKAQTVLKHCGRTVLDVGCNTGELVEFLFKQGISVKGIDIMANDSRFCSQTSLFEIIEHLKLSYVGTP